MISLMLRVAMASVVAVACQATPTVQRVPSHDEAVGLLAQAISRAQVRDFDGLCRLGGGNCETVLAEAGRDAVPETPPALAGDFIVETTTKPDGSSQVGGRVLVLCGTDGRRVPYRTEMLVFFSGGRLTAIEPVYWSGIGIATSPVTAPSDDPSAAAIPCP